MTAPLNVTAFVPFSIDRVSLNSVDDPENATVPALARVSLLKVLLPVIVWAAPFKITFPLPALKPPVALLLVQLPPIVNVFEPVMVREAPELIIRLLQAGATIVSMIAGWKVAVAGIVTLIVGVGIPVLQLSGSNQSVLTTPTQVPGSRPPPTFKIPGAAAKK